MPKKTMPPQHQSHQPGTESEMHPKPITDNPTYKGSNKLKDKVAIITGGDSGIGKAVATLFAKEGADIAILYLSEHNDAREAKQQVEKYGRQCKLYSGDVGDEDFCQQTVEQIFTDFQRIDILVNNAAEQHPQDDIQKITKEQLEGTFRTNIFGYFYMIKAVMKYLQTGSTIINTTSVTAYRGSEHLLDYASTKGAIVALTRSLALNLAAKNIRVNGVAPGPIWTPLIPSTFPAEKVESFGGDVPLGRAGQPIEVAPAYVFLASKDSSYMTGQVLHPNGGEVVNA